jgi:outer membrane protein TolC
MKQLFFLLLSLAATVLVAQEVPLSLSDAVQRGLENNYQIRIANNNVAVAEAQDSWALAGRYPTINLSIQPGLAYRNNTNPASIVVSSAVTSYSLAPAANFSWTLFNGNRVELTKEQSARRVDLSEGELMLAVENNAQAIIRAYYGALVQRERIDVLQDVLKLSRDRIEYQELRREYGQGGSFDALQARDAYLNDSTNLLTQQITYENAVRSLLQVMGETDPNLEIRLSDELEFTPTPYDRQDLTQRLMTNNRSLQNLLVNRDLANYNTRLAESNNAPTVNLLAGASYSFDVQTGIQTFDFGGGQPSREQDLPGVAARTLSGNIGVGVNYLLYDGGARKQRIQIAQLQETTAQLDYEANKQNLQILLNNTLSTYDNQTELLGLSDALISNAAENLTIAEERLKGGVINSFDYRQIQLNYLNATFQRLSALQNIKATETELLRLTGQIVR